MPNYFLKPSDIVGTIGLVPNYFLQPSDIDRTIKSCAKLKMAQCNKGFGGCPGKVPLTSKQCKGHRFFARMKSKMEASMGKWPENSWVKAGKNMNRVRHSYCLKECCSQEWLPSQQVTKKMLPVDL